MFFGVLLLGSCAVMADNAQMGVERIARFAPIGYAAKPAGKDGVACWMQVDLGKSVKIEKVKLLPRCNGYSINSPNYPVRFKLEASDDRDFKTAACIADHTASDTADPMDIVAIFPGNGVSGRYVRLTVTKMRKRMFDLSKLEVWSAGRDVAEGRPISDSITGELGKTLLTRHPRPQGENDVTDNPGNIIPADQWKPVAYQAQAPLGGVRLNGGVFADAMERNAEYLLKSFTVDEMLREFRTRAGKPNPPGIRAPHKFWEEALAGSCAGRFLMGAGNSVRWMDHAELRARMNAIIDGIEDCRQPNGYIMAYPEDTIFVSERAAYTRSWLTHGMIDAGFAGNEKAFNLLRGYYDWFDTNPYLPELLRRGGQGVQGMIANARMYFKFRGEKPCCPGNSFCRSRERPSITLAPTGS